MSNDQPTPQWQQPTQSDPSFQYQGAAPGSQQPWQAPERGRDAGGVASGEERTSAMLAHLSAPIAAIVSAGWLTIVGPLVLWLIYRDRSWFVRNAAAGAFNFTISMWLLTVVGWLMIFTIILSPLGAILLAVGALGSIVLGCLGAYKTYNGEAYRYPWQFKVLS